MMYSLSPQDKILPDDTITDEAKEETLDKLTTLIQQRLVLSKIPTKFKTVEMGKNKTIQVIGVMSKILCRFFHICNPDMDYILEW